MTAAPQQAIERGTLYSCRLGRSDLNRLTEIATLGVDPGCIEVVTIHDNVRFTAARLDDLISTVEGSSQYDDRVPWAVYAVQAEDSASGRSLYVEVNDEEVEVQFSGVDRIWVAGQFARLVLFLERRNGSLDQKAGKRDAKLALSTTLSLLFWLGLYALYGAFPDNKYLAGLNTAIFVIFMALQLASVARYIVRHNVARGRIDFTRDLPNGSLWSRMDNPTRILALTLVATSFAAVAAGVSAIVDVIKDG
ncbi:hypothetical protein AB0C98_26715 [Streptomyces sp. NPDC048558]|uniref:hypothetical protein n=1 Tax=Streptomyces sp. NPDC048558 TaxID=3155759 RepID=UPI00341E9205